MLPRTYLALTACTIIGTQIRTTCQVRTTYQVRSSYMLYATRYGLHVYAVREATEFAEGWDDFSALVFIHRRKRVLAVVTVGVSGRPLRAPNFVSLGTLGGSIGGKARPIDVRC